MVLKRGSARKTKTFGKTPQDLNRAIKAAELLALKLGLIRETKTERTFGELAGEWYQLNLSRWQPATQERYQGILRHFLIPLYNLPLHKVDRNQVKRLLVELRQIRSAKTVEVIYSVTSGIFTEAIDLGYTEVNPAHGLLKRILPPKNKRPQSEPDPLTQDDLARLLEEAWRKLPAPLALVLETMAMTGMRLGECLALSWENLDAKNQLYSVTETTRVGRFGPPKSGKRIIDLTADLVTKLEAHIHEMRKASVSSGHLSRSAKVQTSVASSNRSTTASMSEGWTFIPPLLIFSRSRPLR